ncbi:MAG TPA: type II toxin-antitoxin system RelE/ParE family toxin [Azospirillaceae bacterium]|nr:type II toxin-antitoxin system RelE/ParE family toxin [Azospirillaceae bacterium]
MHILSEDAERDLEAIWLYVWRESGFEAVADRQIDVIVERFHLLAGFPHLGRARDEDLGRGRRTYPVGPYVIVYAVRGADVHILRVAHGKRDLHALMR